jgi:hypothetical protein
MSSSIIKNVNGPETAFPWDDLPVETVVVVGSAEPEMVAELQEVAVLGNSAAVAVAAAAVAAAAAAAAVLLTMSVPAAVVW